jgi:hypothetical protein
MTVTLHVCITCRAGQTLSEGETAPARACMPPFSTPACPKVSAWFRRMSVRVQPGLLGRAQRAGRWSYVYGRLSDANARDVIAGASAYAAAPDGVVPWRSRPKFSASNHLLAFRPLPSCRRPPNELPHQGPVTVVTGFLGSGKTTLIRHLITNANGKKLAVLVNEFGSEGVDGEILKSCADANCPRRTSLSSPMAASAAPWPTISFRRWSNCSRAR